MRLIDVLRQTRMTVSSSEAKRVTVMGKVRWNGVVMDDLLAEVEVKHGDRMQVGDSSVVEFSKTDDGRMLFLSNTVESSFRCNPTAIAAPPLDHPPHPELPRRRRTNRRRGSAGSGQAGRSADVL